MPPSLDALRTRYANAGQGHVFTFYDQLSGQEQQSLVRQLEGIDIERVNRVWARAIQAEEEERCKAQRAREHPEGARGDGIEPLPEQAMASLVSASDDTDTDTDTDSARQAREWKAMGTRAVADNHVAVLLMAGGQGTRLGSSAPKGCYDIGLHSHKSLFQLQGERIRRLAQLAREGAAAAVAVRIPWYVMTSGPTRAATEAFFREHAFFGLDPEDVVFFDQGVLPALSNDGKIMLASTSSVAVAPDGNGGLYAAIRQSPSTAPGGRTVLQDMHARGIRYVHAYCVDNCLVKVADPVFLGYCIARRAACGAKVVRKEDPHESVGVLAMRDGAYSVVEYSELSREKAEQRTDRGGLAYRAANIANHFYTLDFLDSVEAIESRMAFHIARKKIPTVDLATGAAVKPESPNGMKLELFVFDVFPFTDALGVLEVERAQEFSPLKNAPGSAGDNPETSRRDIYAQHKNWLEAAGARVADGCEVEVSPLVSYNGEGLEQYRGKVFEASTRLD